MYYLDRSEIFCEPCQFYSPAHHACFHPEAWKPGFPFKEPGNPAVLNANNDCPWYDTTPVHSNGKAYAVKRVRKFFRGLAKPLRIRITK